MTKERPRVPGADVKLDYAIARNAEGDKPRQIGPRTVCGTASSLSDLTGQESFGIESVR